MVHESDILEAKVASNTRQLDRSGAVFDLDRQIEHLKHALERNHRRRKIHARVYERRSRPRIQNLNVPEWRMRKGVQAYDWNATHRG